MNYLKKIISYLYPIIIKTVASNQSGNLEVTLVNGKLVMDSSNTNYSYGSLQKVLKIGLQQFETSELKQAKNILILGVAGGSIIETLQQDFQLTEAKITGVEIDQAAVRLANDYFKIDQKPNVKIVIEDAFQFIKTPKNEYDLIIIDIFNDQQMPIKLFTNPFWTNIHNNLNTNGLALFNSIITSSKDNSRNNQLNKVLVSKFSAVSRKKTHINELFILKK